MEPGLLSAVLNYLADEEDAAPLPPVELDAPEPEAGAGDDEDDDDDPEDGAGADEDDDDDPDGAGAVEDDEDEPPGTTTVDFSFVLLLVLEPLPLDPGATTAVSFCSLQAPSANALSSTNVHVPCFPVISSPWGELQQVAAQAM